MRVDRSQRGAAPECKGGGNGRSPRKKHHRSAASSPDKFTSHAGANQESVTNRGTKDPCNASVPGQAGMQKAMLRRLPVRQLWSNHEQIPEIAWSDSEIGKAGPGIETRLLQNADPIISESPIATTGRTPVLLVSALELTIVLLVHPTPDTTLHFTAFIKGRLRERMIPRLHEAFFAAETRKYWILGWFGHPRATCIYLFKHQKTAQVAWNLSMLASHQGDPGSIPGRATPGSCRTMPLVGWFSRQSPASPAPSFQRRSILILITLIGSQDLNQDVRYVLVCPEEWPPSRHGMTPCGAAYSGAVIRFSLRVRPDCLETTLPVVPKTARFLFVKNSYALLDKTPSQMPSGARMLSGQENTDLSIPLAKDGDLFVSRTRAQASVRPNGHSLVAVSPHFLNQAFADYLMYEVLGGFLHLSCITSAGMKGRRKGEIPDKNPRPTSSSGTIPTYENPERSGRVLNPDYLGGRRAG
ncbi:hypothetical protein PR048_024038 [Dryococelus australis]|uniref:Uncharacterized protein n=1 Tax=Dryococelus australis TaxID=614101 RepID=A0ABQ9GVX4_9NEOP|nr:hypothetical protein PR048_024038 [Dryococelus australis]